MDALAGYGSESDSEDDNKPTGGGALSGLLAHYSDDSDGHENKIAHSNNKNSADGKEAESSARVNGDGNGKDLTINDNPKSNCQERSAGQRRKRRRRWDNPSGDAHGVSVDIDSVLPPPLLASETRAQASVNDPFQALVLFGKDYTTDLRRKLSQQLQTQSQEKEIPKEKQQLNDKLEQMRRKFQESNMNEEGASSASSFASHLKSQHEFGNPALLKNIIDHFGISPLESSTGNSFKGFEFVDRLIPAEERARIAAANYDASKGAALSEPGQGG